MQSIKDKVAIVGMGCTKFGENWGMSFDDMVIDAVYEAYEDAGIPPADVQAVWIGSYWSNLPAPSQPLSTTLKLDYKPVTRLENMCATASDAFRNAAYAVASGACDIALAIGAEKLKDSGYSGLPTDDIAMGLVSTAPNTFRSRNFTAPGHFAMMATSYFNKYGLTPEEGRTLLAKIMVKNHHNGTMSPKAHFRREITVEQVLKAPVIAWPLGLLDCCGVSDGAAAAILVRKDMAKNFKPDPVYVKAMQIAVGPSEGYMNPKHDWTGVKETYRAGQAAYAEAGVNDPRKEITMAEVHDCFSITEAIVYEDLQFSPRGRFKDDVEAGTFELTGELPINIDGGLKCFGHPIGATGLRMIYELYNQILGRAGQRQLKNPGLGLAHNLGGTPGGATISVTIVGP
ncbi:MAG: acetyl-CoA acetyltransferase [Desulfomonile tiedjei]|uniref:Acetyl-CoA acetyltransferase n=1 Tax=Desulfomonile tiedjei TaxID=2358 RepID=A0A9D6V4I0_9BACT|nr:acetyl-CoA acetyltransferase [Desulfomonile tiedjei]